MNLPGYDAWKMTEPASSDPGRRHPQRARFQCTECEWRGCGYRARADHFHDTGHAIIHTVETRRRAASDKE